MAKVKDDGRGIYRFFCPGCGHDHSYYTQEPYHNGAMWEFNKNLDSPTFSPSLLNRWGKEADPNWKEPETPAPDKSGWSGRCHLFVIDGHIHYCNDCTHDYSGKTVPMEDVIIHH